LPFHTAATISFSEKALAFWLGAASLDFGEAASGFIVSGFSSRGGAAFAGLPAALAGSGFFLSALTLTASGFFFVAFAVFFFSAFLPEFGAGETFTLALGFDGFVLFFFKQRPSLIDYTTFSRFVRAQLPFSESFKRRDRLTTKFLLSKYFSATINLKTPDNSGNKGCGQNYFS
jgi:hypothetical protein